MNLCKKWASIGRLDALLAKTLILERHQASETDLKFDYSYFQVVDYLDVIDEPMDFSTMSKRIEDNHYTAMEQFERDFNLIIHNCMTYNSPDTIYYRAALKLRDQGRPVVRAARRQVERAGIDPVTGLHTEEPPTLADREPTEEGSLWSLLCWCTFL